MKKILLITTVVLTSFINVNAHDVLSGNSSVQSYGKRFFAHCQTPNPKYFTKGFLTNQGNHTQFGPGNTANYGPMEFDNTGKLYCVNSSLPSQPLQLLDTTTGDVTTLGSITGLVGTNEQVFSMAFNPVNTKMYFTTYEGTVHFKLYTLELSTREATFIGEGDVNLSDVAINNTGQCFGIAAVGLFIGINLSNGLFEIIGEQGYNSTPFKQGLCFDRETDSLWLSGWNVDSSRGELRTVNLMNGNTTLVSQFNPEVGRVVGLSIPFKSMVGINNISSQIPKAHNLEQNYPNPFNPKTVIRYSLIENHFVTLKVYNALGNEVAILINQKQSSGIYLIDFDGSNLSSGIYFYKLSLDGFTNTKSMILLK